jgi:hypothetical protein
MFTGTLAFVLLVEENTINTENYRLLPHALTSKNSHFAHRMNNYQNKQIMFLDRINGTAL